MRIHRDRSTAAPASPKHQPYQFTRSLLWLSGWVVVLGGSLTCLSGCPSPAVYAMREEPIEPYRPPEDPLAPESLERAGLMLETDKMAGLPAGLPAILEPEAPKSPAMLVMPGTLPRSAQDASEAKGDGLEKRREWLAEAWANSLRAAVVEAVEEGGAGYVLSLTTDPDRTGKFAVSLDANALGKRSQTPTHVELDAYAAGPGIQVAIALKVGQDDTYVESMPRALRTGWSRGLTFSLQDATWKSEASNWEFNTTVPPGATRTLTVLIYGPLGRSPVLLDNFNLRP